MAITVNPLPEREGSFDASPSKTLTRKWIVLFDDIADGSELAAIQAVGLPAIYTSHPDVAGAEINRIRGIQDTAEGEGRRWEVHVEWSTGRGSAAGGAAGARAPMGPTGGGQVPESQRDENPLARGPLVRIRHEYIDYHSEYARPDKIAAEDFGRLIHNSAGDPFDPSLAFRERITVVTVTKNKPNLDLKQIAKFDDSVNQFPYDFGGIGIFDAESIWLTFEETQLHRENGVEFWPVTGVFRIREYYELALNTNPPTVIQAGGWQPLILNAGYREFVAPFKPRKVIKDGTGNPVSKPVPLDEDGKQIPDPDPGQPPKPRVFLRFCQKKQEDFDELTLF